MTAGREQHEGSETRRTWTPGPWTWRDPNISSGNDGFRWFSSDTLDGGDATSVVWSNATMTTIAADAALIALAPDLAEAVLEQFRRYPDCDIVRDLAPRLLALGCADA